jgi:hypothetical protein
MNYFEDTHFAQTTITLYNMKIKKWIEYMPDDKKSIIHIALNKKDSVEILRSALEKPTNANLHGYYSSIIAFIEYNTYLPKLFDKKFLEDLFQDWAKLRKENESTIVQRRLDNKPSEMQSAKGGVKITFDDIVKKRDSLKYGSPERLLLGFYTYLPPVRADYFTTEIVAFRQKPKEQNYIRLITPTQARCVLRDFKTKAKYERIENDLPSELNDELRYSLKENPRDYLFINASGEPFTRNAFSTWSKRILSKLFNTQMTLVIIRHLFISTIDFNKLSDKQLTDLGNKMGHSLSTQRTYRWIKDGDDEDEDDHEHDMDDKSSVDEDDTKNVIIEG